MASECCVCYATPDEIGARYMSSFVTIPCDGKHVVCFKCFMKNENRKCPMCRYDYAEIEEEQPMQYEEECEEEYDERLRNNYEIIYAVQREFACLDRTCCEEELANASRIWSEVTDESIDRLIDRVKHAFDSNIIINDDSLYSPTFDDMSRVIRDMRRCFSGDILSEIESSYDVCRIVYRPVSNLRPLLHN